jgi:hypothetical protein
VVSFVIGKGNQDIVGINYRVNVMKKQKIKKKRVDFVHSAHGAMLRNQRHFADITLLHYSLWHNTKIFICLLGVSCLAVRPVICNT